MDLSDRQLQYEQAFDYKLTQRVPVIIRVDGRNFTKVLRNVQKPFCDRTSKIMTGVMAQMLKVVDGAVFGYQNNDEISIVLKNDGNPWFGNRIQKICSTAASLATYHFQDLFWSMDPAPPIEDPTIFDAFVFLAANDTEAANNIINRQNECVRNAINNTLYSKLIEKYSDRRKVHSILDSKSTSERERMLIDDFSVDIWKDYPEAFTCGISAYIVPKTVHIEEKEVVRRRWKIDESPSLYTNSPEKLVSIIREGMDVFQSG